MKKRFFLVMVVVALFAGTILTGCGKNDSKNAQPSEQTAEEKKEAATKDPKDVKGDITFTAWGSDSELEVDKKAIAEFNKIYPNVKVNFQPINDAYLTKVETMMVAGEAPDVIYGHPKYFQKWASQDLLLDLTDYYKNTKEFHDKDVYATNLYDAFTYNGKTVATINGADTFLLFYNKDLFDKAGVKYPTADWTWNDFLDACKKLTIDKDGDGEIDQYAISPSGGREQIEAFMAAFGGSLYDDMDNPTKVLVKDEKNKKALQMWHDLIFKYKYAPDAEGSEVVKAGFDGGQVAMDLDGVYQCVYRSAVNFKMGLASLPMEDKDSHHVSLMAGYCVPKTTKYPEAAWAFASFMQKEAGQKVLAETGLITTVNKNIAKSDEVINMKGAPDNHILRVTSLDNAVNVDPKLSNWEETVNTVWQPAIDKFYNNDIDVDEVLETLQSGLESYLQQGK